MKSLLALFCLSILGCNSTNGHKTMEELNKTTDTSLLNVTQKNYNDQLSEVLKKKPDLEMRDDEGKTALMMAAYNEDNVAAELLISAGADVNAQDNMLNSPFLYAGANGNVALLKMCLEHGANFKIYNRYGGTALIPAAEKGHLEIVEILTKVPDFPIDHINKLGWTALIEAVILSKQNDTQTAIVKTLVDAGSDVNIPDGDGVTSLEHAKKRSLTAIISILEEAGGK